MKKAFSIVFLLLFSIINGNADSPPSWTPYKVESENGEFFTWLRFVDSDATKSPWERKWTLIVYTKDSTELWQQQIRPMGYPEGKLSNDGKYFSYVNYWYYSDSPVVEVYRREKKPFAITGDKFDIPTQYLQQTSSHRLWLADKGYHYANGAKQQLIINTRDSNTWVVDLETGDIKVEGMNMNYVYAFLASSIIITLLYILFRKRSRITSANKT
ncbi:hypothetical protein [Pontibacter virosus]|uniref:PepSY-associated transmembrane protein n=1 Tax=Pontibacter virosus TaxID=1765052 RepID=A0A2U1AV88_9BACT|nr:hypothetical protein [Pontibacter virosus]PVY40271.1 hypothetical protein C8E01_108165 [Pontibacter virosus]